VVLEIAAAVLFEARSAVVSDNPGAAPPYFGSYAVSLAFSLRCFGNLPRVAWGPLGRSVKYKAKSIKQGTMLLQ
jgi:hypothetical protein